MGMSSVVTAVKTVLAPLVDAPAAGIDHQGRVDAIRLTCWQHGLESVDSTGQVQDTAQYVRYGLRTSSQDLGRLMHLHEPLAMALNVQSVHISRKGHTVWVAIPKGRTDSVSFGQAWALAEVPMRGLLLGLNDEGGQLYMMLDETAPHCAVIGMTGSGKSTLMRTMVLSAQMNGRAVALFDPSGGLWPLSGHPRVWRAGMFRDTDHIAWGLEALAGRQSDGLLFVFVDEVPTLIAEEPAIGQRLTRIAREGRHHGLRLVIGAQDPLASELRALNNMPKRLVGKVAGKQAAYQATGKQGSGAESLRGYGDFIAVGGGALRHFQAAMIEPARLAAWAAQYPPREAMRPATTEMEEALGSDNTGGRPLDEIPDWLVRAILDYREANEGQAPSGRWVRALTKQRTGEGFNRDKQLRALALAEEAWGDE